MTYGEVTSVSAEYTSPNMKKSSRPRFAAYASSAVAHWVQKSRSTCLTVSMRKPSMSKSRTHFS